MKKQLSLSVAILLACGAGYAVLSTLKPEYDDQAETDFAYSAKVQTLRSNNHEIQIPISGTVSPAHTYKFLANVEGNINTINPSLINGATFAEGDILFTIDAQQYLLEQEKATAELNIASSNLEKAEATSKAGILAWNLNKQLEEKINLEKSNNDESYKLATGLIDVEIQENTLDSSIANVALSDIDVQRTQFKAPCNGVVLNEDVALNQFVQVADNLMTYACTDYFYLKSDINSNKLALLDFDENKKIISSGLVYNIDNSLTKYTYKTSVISLLANVDDIAKMATLLLKVEQPFKYDIPLFINSFVKGYVVSKKFENTFKIKRSSLRNNSSVWLLDNKNNLKIQQVNIAFSDTDYIYIDQGLANGDRLITTKIPAAVNGIKINVYE